MWRTQTPILISTLTANYYMTIPIALTSAIPIAITLATTTDVTTPTSPYHHAMSPSSGVGGTLRLRAVAERHVPLARAASGALQTGTGCVCVCVCV